MIGEKLGMTQIFRENGEVVPTTVLRVGPCLVVRIGRGGKDARPAVQMGFGDVEEKRLTKPLRGHFSKAGVAPRRVLRESRIPGDELDSYSVGQEILVSVFKKGDLVDVTGTSKGRGFAGVVKRHGFAGFKASHGTHEYFRHGGSIGAAMTGGGRTFRGRRMPGRLGGARNTVHNLEVLEVREEENLLFIRGAVPGPVHSTVTVRKAVKGCRKRKKGR